ncbi:unnamed protein product [Cylindrotheca closterium]|uniref:Protein kinase domain-containing protein n=1 Tax=Cylindrotheca closterium TaxID=2856 RepID=A0AAD2JP89_9STRA|nr:unnamed protein product [Cylindrotheca closterium]
MASEFQNECDENSPDDYSHGDSAMMKIWRTKSLDDEQPSFQSATGAKVHVEKAADSTRSLHSSFDAALFLDSNAKTAEWFDPERHRNVVYANKVRSEFSGKKHMRQKFQMDAAEASMAGTFQKQAQADISLAEPSQQLKFQTHTSMPKSCSSVSKRRRIPSQTIRSPIPKNGARIADLNIKALYQRSSTSEWSLSPNILMKGSGNLTPLKQCGTTYTMLHPTSLSKVHSTGTKTASTAALETTEEFDSCESSPPSMEPFRFTSFPESLPRLNNPVERHYAESICRRMSFGERNGINVSNQSREDDGTHDTSISSLSADGRRHSPMCVVPSYKDLAKASQRDSNSVPKQSAPLPGCADFEQRITTSDSTPNSPGSNTVGRMRLDFNAHLSPTQMIGDSPPTSFVPSLLKSRHTGENNFPRTLTAASPPPTHSKLMSSSNESEEPLTPNQSCAKQVPTTPQDVLLHFPPETECSPIPSSDQQEEHKTHWQHGPSIVGPSVFSKSAIYTHVPGASIADAQLERREQDFPISSAIAKQSQMRPMPDMSAFESAAYSSRGNRSTDDSLIVETAKGLPTLPGCLCPATPVRTPAWASDAGGTFMSGRQNSLISTKLLLACPSHVLEGRTSLEDSLLEEDYNPESSDALCGIAKKNDSAYSEGKPGAGPSLLSQDMNETKRDASRIYDTSLPTIGNNLNLPQISKDNRLVSFRNDFEVISSLGSGAFADAFKVRAQIDGRLYAVKRNRRKFRGIRDRNLALAEVQHMQRLQDVGTAACAIDAKKDFSQSTDKSTYSLYLLFFYRAWQEDGYFFCQTELCCRDSCKELLDSIRLRWKSSNIKYPSLSRHISPPNDALAAINANCSLRYLPHSTVWKVCHDIAAGLSHMHSHGLVHHDIKPSNILFVRNPRFGAMCKICDFGLAGEIDSSSDGQEGDTRYMPSELLSSMTRQPSADIFSLGLTLYEIASDHHIELPSEGPLWHRLRTNSMPQLPDFRGLPFCELIKAMTHPSAQRRPTADEILSLDGVVSSGQGFDLFLEDYVVDVAKYERLEEERFAAGNHDDQTPRNWSGRPRVTQSPSLSMLLSSENNLLSPGVQ